MKRVFFKVVPITNPNSGEVGELDYRAYSEIAIRQPLDGKSAGIDEMHKSIRLLEALRNAKGDGVDFEDSDFDYFCLKVNAIKFNWVDPVFIEFVEDVTNAE